MMWWQWVAYGFIWVTMCGYTTWLYAVVLEDRKADREHFARVVKELRADIKRVAEAVGVDLDFEEPNPVVPPGTDEMPVVEPQTDEMPAAPRPVPYSRLKPPPPPKPPTTVEADAADTFARQEVVLSKHRGPGGSRSVSDILAEAGLEPLKRRRW